MLVINATKYIADCVSDVLKGLSAAGEMTVTIVRIKKKVALIRNVSAIRFVEPANAIILYRIRACADNEDKKVIAKDTFARLITMLSFTYVK